ncbi:SrfA family protein [Pseudomonas sp. TTU2014-080ASC]|uniref:SrfA family protein n=1 Tax=Pseudomonas sp. TTU2014-080ASC TaxID=1729724 RepID=UPI000718A28E|nr:SrfA family protein [Pseudomonas sp. TTU2014-080ASC]KRW60842.1 Breakpoint cluster region protein [Pseudomonas sp. TTU2014-080ASC]
MPGALLRTGNLQEFKALGVDGQPVYSAALQLREAIRLKMGREAASCLAIPQPNETGDRIDWYAPEEGDVVPWSAATEEERSDAYKQLEAMHAQLGNTSVSMKGDTQNREKQIFGRLLEKTVHFPDSDHVYLVNGKPVITFWGFTDQPGTYDHDPLLCLRPAAPVAKPLDFTLPPEAPAVAPAAAPVVAAKRPWWRWLLWLLPLLLLLLLLLFLLRACAPNVPLPLGLDQIDLPGLPVTRDVNVHDVNVHGVDGTVIGNGGISGQAVDGQLPDGQLPEGQVPDGQQPQDQAPADDAAQPEAPAEEPKTDEAGKDEQTPPGEEGAEPQPPVDPEMGQPNPRQQPPGKDVPQDLSIPPQALQTGSTDFLNGSWKAGAGIQDAKTGKPMQLEYDFKDGKGEVKMRRGDGVVCSGSVNAAMQGGKLAINNQGQATCNDGSTYKLPEVTCSPDSRSAADCSGSYENQQFPMSMRQGEKQ